MRGGAGCDSLWSAGLVQIGADGAALNRGSEMTPHAYAKLFATRPRTQPRGGDPFSALSPEELRGMRCKRVAWSRRNLGSPSASFTALRAYQPGVELLRHQ